MRSLWGDYPFTCSAPRFQAPKGRAWVSRSPSVDCSWQWQGPEGITLGEKARPWSRPGDPMLASPLTHCAWPPSSPHTEHLFVPPARMWQPGAGHTPLVPLTLTGVAGGLLLALESTAGTGRLPKEMGGPQIEIRPPVASTCTLAMALGQSLWSNPLGQGSVRQVPMSRNPPCSARPLCGLDSAIHFSCYETSFRGMNPPPLPTSQVKLSWPRHT